MPTNGRRPASNPQQGNARPTASNQRETLPDTFGVFLFQVDNPNEEIAFTDSSLLHVHQYDPTRRRADDYGHLGIVGTAHYPLVYRSRQRRGLDLGWHQYDLYHNFGNTANYYRLERPFTNLYFMQGGEQRDNIVGAEFSRNFADGLNYMIDYQAITQEAQPLQYPNQQNQTRSLVTGMWWHSKNGRYDGFLSYAANTTNSQDNGGVIALGERGEYNSPLNADVFLEDGLSRYALREIMYTQHYRFGGQTDSTGQGRRAFSLSHQLDYDQNTYRFSDERTRSDDSFYLLFTQLLDEVDTRGVRYFVQHRSLANSFRLSTFKLQSDVRTAERQQRDLLEVGLSHQYHQVGLEPIDTVVNNLLLTGKIGLRAGKRLRLHADGQLALFDQRGDFRLHGELALDLGKAGQWLLHLTNQLYSPTLLQDRFYLLQRKVWDNDFSKTLETNAGLTYQLPAFGFEVSGNYHLINKLIYYDTSGLPQQASGVSNVLQLAVQKDFRFGHFVFSNRLVLQQAPSEVLRMPTLFGKHSFFYTGRWFKVLQVQTGLDLRYVSDFYPYYYNPFVGQFQLQDRREATFVPNLDLYFTMRVSTFRAFAKMENINTFWAPNDRLVLTAYYPYPAAGFRFGLIWRMLD